MIVLNSRKLTKTIVTKSGSCPVPSRELLRLDSIDPCWRGKPFSHGHCWITGAFSLIEIPLDCVSRGLEEPEAPLLEDIGV
jgi:hypothetical protein